MEKIYFYTDKGKVRENNEDAVLVNSEIFLGYKEGEKKIEEEYMILVVADGMGGYSKGEIASQKTLEILRDKKPNDKESLKEALEISQEVLEKIAKEKMIEIGTALAGVIKIAENRILIFNVGDCRIYRILPYSSVKLSRDHTVVENLLQEGVINEEEARSHPKQHILTSAISGGIDTKNFEIFTKEITLYKKDIILICSDGFWNEFEEEMNRISLSENPIKEVKELTMNKKLQDNLSFIILKRM